MNNYFDLTWVQVTGESHSVSYLYKNEMSNNSTTVARKLDVCYFDPTGFHYIEF